MKLWLVALIVALTPPAMAQADPCAVTLQSRIDAAPPGSTLMLPPCLYRQAATIHQPLVLDGSAGAEIRGSDVWLGWTQSGSSTWTSVLAVPQMGDERPYLYDGRCGPPTNPTLACVYHEAVYSDGVPVAFTLDASRHVVLSSNPSGHVIEVAIRPTWIRTASDHVTIRGFVMRHATNPITTGAISNSGYSDWQLTDNTLALTHGITVHLNEGVGAQVLRNDISLSGEAGIGGHTRGALIQGNAIHDNGSVVVAGYGGAGAKVDGDSISLVGNDVYRNPYGLWADILTTNWRVLDNHVHDNLDDGILFEISDGATIQGNTVWSNGWGRQAWVWGAGISVQSSANAEVSNNLVAWNYGGISVVILTRRDRPPSMAGTVIHDNTILREITNTSYFWGNQLIAVTDAAGGVDVDAFPPVVRDNKLWADKAEGYPPVRLTWRNVAYAQLRQFAVASGDTTTGYLSETDAFDALSGSLIPPRVSPKAPPPTPTAAPTPTLTAVPTPTPTCVIILLVNGTPTPFKRQQTACQDQ